MEQNSEKVIEAPGAEITVQKVEEYLKKDLSVALSCLHAIYSDPDLLRYMAIFMRGRQLNFEQSQKLKHSAD